MTGSVLRTAIPRLGQFAIRANAGLCVQAPEKAVIANRHRGIGFGKDELALPAQRWTEVRIIGVEAVQFLDHAAPPAAFNIARTTATLASVTLYAF